ncbi:MAG TPA: PmeII family type II restriction endonuclease [Desulfomonilia bacterium]
MGKITIFEITSYIENNIKGFHDRRIDNLLKLKLNKIIARKNPYLFKARNINIAEELVKTLLDAHLSSQEEGIFGDFLEGLAIFVCSKVYGGKKSSATGIDLEFENKDKRYIISIKSGPNWGNSRQIAKMKDDFKRTKQTLRTSNSNIITIAINGCCYGQDNKPDKGDYYKLCGQRFWEFISGNEFLYTDIIEPLGHKAKQRNDEFNKEYAKVINRFTVEFSKDYCSSDGAILWEKLVKYNSGKKNV